MNQWRDLLQVFIKLDVDTCSLCLCLKQYGGFFSKLLIVFFSPIILTPDQAVEFLKSIKQTLSTNTWFDKVYLK